MAIQNDRVKLNVGGKIFETTATTLAKAGRDSLLGAMFDDNWNLRSDTTTEHFIDRDPDYFSVLLNLLRTGELYYIPSNLSEKLLYQEALFYGLLDHVRSAKWGPLDGNRLHPSQSVTARAPRKGKLIRASPDGGCCVAHENILHVYDWMMEERPLINLNYKKINDAGWIDQDKIVITTTVQMGLFSSSNGELRHKFNVDHEGKVKWYAACGFSFNSDYKIFASYKGLCNNEYGIGVWDQNTGKQVDFFCEPDGGSTGDADKIQWITSSNCLLVANLHHLKDYWRISLLDFRVKKIVNSWSDNKFLKDGDRSWNGVRLRDAVLMEDLNSICVVNESEGLGFIDFRIETGGVRWIPKETHSMSWNPNIEQCYPKLGFHEGQLFSSMNGCVSVYSWPDWVLSTRLQRSDCGFIRDISIGGDRLFALHGDKNVFDIWEAPRSLII